MNWSTIDIALDMQRLEMVNRISGLLECSIFYGKLKTTAAESSSTI
jgi:hypothetical protein